MKNLEEIGKNSPFTVPEGYFDRLPGAIQLRTTDAVKEKQSRPYFRYALQYALPVLFLAAGAVFYLNQAPQDADSLLSSVSTQELEAYLQESEATTEDLLESLDIESAEAIEAEVYFNFNLDENNLNELDLDNL